MNNFWERKAYVLLLLLATGCTHMDVFGGGNTYREDSASFNEPIVVPAPANVLTPVNANIPTANNPVVMNPDMIDDNDFVNYREVSTEYREFGDRTPRDQRITTAGAGSNMTASIPPTIEEEVMDYEEEVNLAIDGSTETVDELQASGDDMVEDWLAEEGNTLKALLSDWSERAGWRLIWNTNRNYTLSAGAMFRGRFADVSSALIRTFARAKPAPVATFYKGNRVLVVETMEDENAYD